METTLNDNLTKIVRGMPIYFEKIEGINFNERELGYFMFSIPPLCNYRCKKCFSSAGSNKEIKNLLTLEEMFRIIKEAKELGARNVSILGEGEPLIYKNIREVVEYIDSLGMIPMLATNGMMLTKEMADFLYEHNVVLGISLDTLDAKEYRDYCGGNADLDILLKNIDYARRLYAQKIEIKNGYKIYPLLIHMTVTPKNFHYLKPIADFCGSDIFFDCQSLSEVGSAKKNKAFFKDSQNIYGGFKKFGHITNPPMVLSKTEEGKCVCCLFYDGLSVSREGNVMFDAHVKESVKFIGNIRDHPLKYLVEKRKKLRDLFLKNYGLAGYCPIREKDNLKRFMADLKDSKIKP